MGHADNKAREAMIAFLKSGALQAPRVVSTAPSKAADRVGFITPGFDEGTLFLKSAASEHYRLEWAGKAGESGAAADRRRAVPAGEYALVGYRIIRRDAQGTTWFISATGSNLRRLTVQASEEQQASIDETIRLTGGAHPSEGTVEIHVMVAGIKGSGLSIYRDGRRIDIDYRLLDAQGKELARGTLAYG